MSRYASEPVKDFASESGHFYLPSGEPYYTVIAKGTGLPRPATLRDARKVGAYPSVTGILKCADKPALTRYFVMQGILASLTLPRLDGELDDAFVARILTDSKAAGEKARDTGELIHGAIERRDLTGDWSEWVSIAYKTLWDNTRTNEWAQERSFACRVGEFGYGGKIDLHFKGAVQYNGWVVDVKSKDGPADGRKLWDEEICQLAAYRFGLNMPLARCAILHVDRNKPTAEFIEATEDELARGWKMFASLLAYWYAKSGLLLEAA